MARRLRIAAAPNSGVARRLYGDLQTSPGNMLLQDPINAQSSISLNTGSENMGIVIEDRPTDPTGERRFFGGVESGEVTLGFEGPNGQRLFDASGMPGSLGSISWRMFNPQPEPPAHSPTLEMNTTPGNEASIYMFNPQPEPPAMLLSMNTSPSNGASIRMFNPQPEPPAMLINMSTASSGGNLDLFAPQGGALLVNDHPQLRLRCDSTASRMLLQRAFDSMAGPADSIGVLMYADSITSDMKFFRGGNINLKITTNANGTATQYFSNGSEYMGIEPVPWNPSGSLKLYNQTGALSLEFASEGSASFLDDGSEYIGIEPSPWHSGGDLTMINATGGPTLILASNGMVSIGTGAHTNILTVQQYSATDPIADAWTTYSSRRWKTNIQPLQGALDKVMRLNGVSFDWIEGGKHDIGLIAEDVGQVVPEVVAYEDNGVDAKSVDYARLTALLIEAVKEQQKTIELQNDKIEKLENEISNLVGE
jgi:hypothetical protein